MMSRHAEDALYDSEAALRQVEGAILDLAAFDPVVPPLQSPAPVHPPENVGSLASALIKGYDEVLVVLDKLRRSREALQQSSVERLKGTNDKLQEVSSVTELAATDILDGLDRATAMIDQLDVLPPNAVDQAKSIRTSLRDELFAVMGHLQFQDITSQQLSSSSAVIADMEVRLAQLAVILTPAQAHGAMRQFGQHQHSGKFDPDATTTQREARQAVADELVARSRA